MNKKAAKALDESIAHHKRMHDFASVDEFEDENPGARHCALCALYCQISNIDSPCNGCPVMEKTGCGGCNGSPWEAAFDAYIEWKNNPDSKKARTKWRRASTKEIKFLEGLR